MKRFTFLLIISFVQLFCFAQPLIWDVQALDSIRNKPQSDSYKYIIRNGEKAISQGTVAVTDKEKSISGDKHNFESLSIYYWPNPQDSTGPYIVKDGQSNPEYKKYDLPRLSQLNSNTHWLAQAYYLSHNQVYFDAFVQQIDTWFVNKATRMNPQFEYCQFAPGKYNGKGSSAGLIDAYNFIDVIESVRLVNEVQNIGKKRDKAFKKWVTGFASWMQSSSLGKGASKYTNNIGMAYDITLYYMLQYVGEQDQLPTIYQSINKRINAQIEEDGKQPNELKRTKAYSYSIYNLKHLVDFAVLQQNMGNAYLQNDGKRIAKAIQYLEQFVDNKNAFPYKEIGDWNKEVQNLKELKEKCRL